MRIFKYELDVIGVVVLEIPESGEILTIQVQYGKPCIWVLVDPSKPVVTRTFKTYGTGHEVSSEPFDKTLNYLCTYQLQDGKFIGHVFEVIE